jgi:hypothetical protein
VLGALLFVVFQFLPQSEVPGGVVAAGVGAGDVVVGDNAVLNAY